MIAHKERIRPTVPAREFFTSPHTFMALVDNVYNKTAQALHAGVRLDPDENDEHAQDKTMKWHLRREDIARMPACRYINDILFRELGSLGYYGEMLTYKVNPEHIEHVFVNIPPAAEGELGYLVDAAYKQFVPVEADNQQPDYMVIPYRTREDVTSGLARYHIRESAQDYYMRAIFERWYFTQVSPVITVARFSPQGVVEIIPPNLAKQRS